MCEKYLGWSPLHEACNRGNLSVAKLLLRHGALVNCAGMGRETPLHDAARNGHFQVSYVLIFLLVLNHSVTKPVLAPTPSEPHIRNHIHPCRLGIGPVVVCRLLYRTGSLWTPSLAQY